VPTDRNIDKTRELDRQLLEGHRLLDAEKVMSWFTSRELRYDRIDPLGTFPSVCHYARPHERHEPSFQSYSPEGPEEALTTTNYAPPVDIHGGEHKIPLKLEVPGLPTFPRASQQPNSLTPTLVTWIAGVGRRGAAQSTSERNGLEPR
jgi:hypothetical protein